jgi:16S rRNA (uracil1498-N3)-methyltransferase
LPRFFVAPDHVRNGRFTLSGTESHHALVVLRKKPGDEIDLFDGRDASFRGRIESVSEHEIRGVILEESVGAVLSANVILCQALLKGPKWDWLLEKACEIGISKIIPLVTSRTVVQLEDDQIENKLERWRRIALSASKQSGRAQVMSVEAPVALTQWWHGRPEKGFYLIPWEKEDSFRVEDACRGVASKEAYVFVGPEGGWEDDEVAFARRHGAIPVRLGPTLLRSETAGLVSSVLVFRELGVY